MISAQQLEALDPQVRQAMLSLMAEVAARDEQLRAKDALIERRERDVAFKEALIDKLTHEVAVLKRMKFAATSEKFAGSAEQKSLLEDTLDEDLAELYREIKRLGADGDAPGDKAGKKTPKRQALPPYLPRRDVHHEPESTVCGCGCQMQRMGEDVAEKLDYQPGVFTVERHVRGKWVCRHCETLVQAAVPAHVIDKGIPTTGLLAQVLVAKFLDHMPLYRQEAVFERAGHLIARSTLAQWVGECGAQLQPLVQALADELRRHAVLHADETPVAMLKPGNGKTHRAYMWSYCTPSSNATKAVVFEFSETRSGENVREFLRLETPSAWKGTLVTDGFSGYRACFDKGVTSAQCMAHARRKFHELWANHSSEVGRQALRFHQSLFRVEREIENKTPEERRRIRQRKSRRVLAVFHRWLVAQRQLVPPGSATIKAIDYSLKRWGELTHFVDDGDVPISNNWVENHIRPIALGRSNWLFAGSLRAGKRAAAVMSLLHSARINGHEPYAYLKDVLERLPTQPASHIEDLLPHRWKPSA
ncbi:IS66 family transposase [Variovorax sp. J22R24]|uniref:IS66 family transposase n=1 Tax=Variovorax gracilis TaxID=3053502 RepID=UPI002577853C|nr:IS66 family transposase [Variovorax sp. J22R24]MDM0109928.1 IS66 family transposase [Variovorax sp. J22R24]